MISLPELLSPAGGMDQLKAAVENGADAVYMGGRLFNARQNAANFDEDDMRWAIEYAHVRGINIYITMNTLIADGEMQQAVDAAGQAYLAGADAVIVQDLGFASLLRRHIPGLPLHLSTQGTVTGADGIRALAPLGFSRVILARELPLDEIAAAAKDSPVPVEVFAHGALCVCYSGQCLMSSMIGARSGNRGRCAQPCRLPYQLGNARGYLLSPKDLCSIELLPELVATGVAALKIEGRMKSPEYVAVVTGIYRKYLDRLGEGRPFSVEREDLQDLLQVFNRGGFTAGYLKGRQGRALISRERPKHWGVPIGKVAAYNRAAGVAEVQLTGTVSMGDGVELANEAMPGGIMTMLSVNGAAVKTASTGRVALGTITGAVKPGDMLYKTSDKALMERASASFSGKPRRRVRIAGKLAAHVGEPIRLHIWDGEGHSAALESDSHAEEARTLPLTEETARMQLMKTGDSPFEFSKLTLELDGRAAAKLSDLNGLRRAALEQLEHACAVRYPDRVGPIAKLPPPGRPGPVRARLSLFFWQWREEYAGILQQADRAYLPYRDCVQGKVPPEGRPLEMMAWLPPVTTGSLNRLIAKQAGEKGRLGIDGVLIGNAGHLEILRGSGLPLVGGASMNAFNHWSLETYAALRLKGITLSHELTMEQIAALPDVGIEKEAAVYGRLPLMVSAHCPVGAEVGRTDGKHCGFCGRGEAYDLIDRMGVRFPLICDPLDCRSVLLNGDRLAVPNLARRLAGAGVSMLRLYVHDEAPEELLRIITLFRQALDGVETEDLKGKGYTKGHYFRGV